MTDYRPSPLLQATNPYLTGIPANSYSPYYTTGHLVPTLLGPDPSAVASQLGPVVPQTVQVAQQKIPRSDRLEVSFGPMPHFCICSKNLCIQGSQFAAINLRLLCVY